MRLLPLSGCDLVLGVEWLAELRPIIWDFKNLKMEFTTKRKQHVLRGQQLSRLIGGDKSSESLIIVI